MRTPPRRPALTRSRSEGSTPSGPRTGATCRSPMATCPTPRPPTGAAAAPAGAATASLSPGSSTGSTATPGSPSRPSDLQKPDGDLPYTAPTYWGGGGPGWSGYCITLPWLIHRQYGDTRIVEQSF